MRVIAFVSLPALFDSDVTVFIGDEHYAASSRVTVTNNAGDLAEIEEPQIRVGSSDAADLRELGLAEQRLEGGQATLGEIWCYGDVPDRLDG